MSVKLNIFLTGATGYVGGSILYRLLNHKDAATFDIIILVRSPEKAKAFEKYGVTAIVGSYSELDKLEDLSAQADYVFQNADCDDVTAANAILKGLRRRKETTGVTPVLIHSSGTGVLADDSMGMFKSDTVYDDMDISGIESLPPTQIHRPVDLAIVEGDKRGDALTHILIPPILWGIPSTPFVKEGLQNPNGLTIPILVKWALLRGSVGVVGKGLNAWGHINIDDLADLYIIIFDSIRSGTNKVHGREGFYFSENGELNWYAMAKAIAVALHEIGKAPSSEPEPYRPEEIAAAGLAKYMGCNARNVANRSKALGWKPKHSTEDFTKDIDREAKQIAAEWKGVTNFAALDGVTALYN